jgi:DNA primase
VKIDSVIEILQTLGCARVKPRGDTVDACCPFAAWRHEKGKDSHPSFSVKACEVGQSYYHCFTCGSKGLLGGMLRELRRMGKSIPDELIDKVCKEDREDSANLNLSYPNMFGPSMEAKIEKKSHEIWDEDEVKEFLGSAPRYILNRGVSLETCRKWEIGYSRENRRAVFPVRRKDGKLVGAMWRKTIDDGCGAKYLPVLPFSKSLYLYGEHLLGQDLQGEAGSPPKLTAPHNGIVLVEGMMDVLRLYGYGYRGSVVGLMTAALSDAQLRTLLELNRPIYLMLDWDMAGIQGRMNCLNKLGGKLPVLDVPGVSRGFGGVSFQAAPLSVL